MMTLLGSLRAFSYYFPGIEVDAGWATNNFIEGFPRVFFGFTIGILIQKIVSEGQIVNWFPNEAGRKIFQLLTNHPLPVYLTLIAVFMFPFHLRGLTFLFSILLVCPALVFAGALANTKSIFVLNASSFLDWISYPVYCLHEPIGNMVAIAKHEWGLVNNIPLPFALSASIISILTAVVLTKFYEEPVRAYLSQKMRSLFKKEKRVRDPSIA